MRYLWELYPAYLHDFSGGSVGHTLIAPLANYLRVWDYSTAARVDAFIANSENVKRRIWKTYRRRARVVYPPVPVQTFHGAASEGYFLIVSEMVAYKRLDYAIRLFAQNGRKLKVVGDGSQYPALKRLAAGNIEFCGRVPDQDLRELYARSSALIMPGEEDFGITMVESLASGKPVIALGRGGALEILDSGCGVFYADPTEACLDDALRAFDRIQTAIDPLQLKRRAAGFSEAVFGRSFRAALSHFWKSGSQSRGTEHVLDLPEQMEPADVDDSASQNSWPSPIRSIEHETRHKQNGGHS